MDKIICILEKGFKKKGLPNGEVIDVTSCYNGCMITTTNLKEDVEKINKYKGFPIYEVCLDNNNIYKGEMLVEATIVKHAPYENEYDHIFFNTKSIKGDNIVHDVE